MTIQKRKRRAREYSRRAARCRRDRRVLIGVTVLWAIVLVIACVKLGLSWDKPDADMPEREQVQETAAEPLSAPLPDFYRADIPLTYDEQKALYDACDEFSVPYELALAVCWQETRFRNISGDGGASTGLMQVQERWHKERMDELGVNDLTDPESNFRVACHFLGELLNRYGNAEDALTAYNSGKPGHSAYSESVMKYMEGEIC